jgi:hypothetical protein
VPKSALKKMDKLQKNIRRSIEVILILNKKKMKRIKPEIRRIMMPIKLTNQQSTAFITLQNDIRNKFARNTLNDLRIMRDMKNIDINPIKYVIDFMLQSLGSGAEASLAAALRDLPATVVAILAVRTWRLERPL